MLLINQFSWETTIITQVLNLLKQGVSDLIQISVSFNENKQLISNTQCVELDEMQLNVPSNITLICEMVKHAVQQY